MNEVLFTEREAVRRMLDYIEKERNRLFDQSLHLLDRLRELDEIDKPIVKEDEPTFEVSKNKLIEEEVHKDIPMQIPMPFMPNFQKYEPCNLTKLSLPEANIIEKMSLAEVIDKINEDHAKEEKAFIPKTEIEAQKDKDEKKKPVKASSYRDVKVITQYIKAILKEAGVPIRTAELIKRLGETGIDISSPYVLLQQAAQYDPKIQRPKHGFYQYNFSA